MMHKEQIESSLMEMCANALSPYNDGWVASDYKKDLVMIQFMLNKLIKKCPNFGKEEDKWEQEILINILKHSE
jgi:hypothetical protein